MIPRTIGVVHLGPLPGAPRYAGTLGTVLEAAAVDAERLTTAGFDALIVENFGDAPFFADDVPKETVAAMTAAAATIRTVVPDIPLGVNVLRNDAVAALAVAAAVDIAFIRVNVLSGVMFTDQGPITGDAARVLRHRRTIAPHVGIFADVMVKHAVPPAGLTLHAAADEAADRGLADALIVSGTSTGATASLDDVHVVREAAPETPVLIGSGVDEATVADYLAAADGVIVGTAIKVDGVTTNPVDFERASKLIAATR